MTTMSPTTTLKTFKLDGFTFQAEECVDGVLINPKLPKAFDNTPMSLARRVIRNGGSGLSSSRTRSRSGMRCMPIVPMNMPTRDVSIGSKRDPSGWPSGRQERTTRCAVSTAEPGTAQAGWESLQPRKKPLPKQVFTTGL